MKDNIDTINRGQIDELLQQLVGVIHSTARTHNEVSAVNIRRRRNGSASIRVTMTSTLYVQPFETYKEQDETIPSVNSWEK
jgi:hypothetical protein